MQMNRREEGREDRRWDERRARGRGERMLVEKRRSWPSWSRGDYGRRELPESYSAICSTRSDEREVRVEVLFGSRDLSHETREFD